MNEILKEYIGDVDLTNYKYMRIDFSDEKTGPGLSDQTSQIGLYLKIAHELGLILILPKRNLFEKHNAGKRIPMKFSDYYDINCIKLDGNLIKVIENEQNLKSNEVLELPSLKRGPHNNIRRFYKQFNYSVKFVRCIQDVKFAKKFVEENKIEGCVHIRRTGRCIVGDVNMGVSGSDWELATRADNVLAVLNSTNAPRNIYIMTDMPPDDPIIEELRNQKKYNFMFLYDFPQLVSVKKQNNYKVFNMENCIMKFVEYKKETKKDIIRFWMENNTK